MSGAGRCEIYTELFPFLASGRLGEAQRTELLEHLRVCTECRRTWAEEEPLFRMASSSSSLTPLEGHPEIRNLDAFARCPERIDQRIHAAIQSHLRQCQTCADLAVRLKSLPDKLGDIVDASEIPLVTSIDAETSNNRIWQRSTHQARRPSWWQTVSAAVRAAFQAAAPRPVLVAFTAMILLAIVPMAYYMLSGPSGEPAIEFARLDSPAFLSEALRGEAERPTVEEDDGWIGLGVFFEAFFDEESYRLELRLQDSLLLSEVIPEESVTPRGKLTLRIRTSSLPAGEYQLVLERFLVDSGLVASRAAYPFILVKE